MSHHFDTKLATFRRKIEGRNRVGFGACGDRNLQRRTVLRLSATPLRQ